MKFKVIDDTTGKIVDRDDFMVARDGSLHEIYRSCPASRHYKIIPERETTTVEKCDWSVSPRVCTKCREPFDSISTAKFCPGCGREILWGDK
jgi:hypothetical protein